MPIMNDLEAAKQMSEKCPEVRVLIVSLHPTPYYLQGSIEAGVLGCILKRDMDYGLVLAVRTFHQSNRFLSKQVAELAGLYIK